MDANLILQGLGTWLIAPMQFFSFLGTEQFYLFIAPALLWCLDAGLGLRLGLGLAVSSSVNSILKLVFHSPRPYWVSERVQALAAETSFGVPSGHAQNAVLVWGLLAAWIKKTWAWIVAILLMLMIGLSRLYLGVHFLGDVLMGWRGRVTRGLPGVSVMHAIDVTNPRTGQVDYRFTPPSADQLASLCSRLRAAQPAWQQAGIERRAAALLEFKAALERHREAVVAALSADTGRFLMAVNEVASTAGAIERWCRQAPGLMQEAQGRSVQVPSIRFRNQWVPYPLVGVISPWNFPMVLAFIDAIPALLAGCAVLIKPSEITPRFAEAVRPAIEDVPELAAVLAIHAGAGETGAAIVPLVDAVCFTGSVRTGRIVAEAAARAFIPAFLELGGKDPVIVTSSS